MSDIAASNDKASDGGEIISNPPENVESSSQVKFDDTKRRTTKRCERKPTKNLSTKRKPMKSRYFENRKECRSLILSGNVAKWTPPKSPYNLIQVQLNFLLVNWLVNSNCAGLNAKFYFLL